MGIGPHSSCFLGNVRLSTVVVFLSEKVMGLKTDDRIVAWQLHFLLFSCHVDILGDQRGRTAIEVVL